MITYDWYRSFVAVYQLGTITRAAEYRNLTQPAVTQHLAALETFVGASLFTRTARQMFPTEHGKALYTQVVTALETLDAVSLRLRHGVTVAVPEIRLGTPREYFHLVAMQQLRHVPFRLWTQFGAARGLLEALRSDELDIVIATERLHLRELEYRKIMEETFVLVGGMELAPPIINPSTTEEQTALQQWAQTQRWVSYGRDLPLIRRFWRQTMATRLHIEPHLIVPDLMTLCTALIAGAGLSVLPAYICADTIATGQLRCIWSPQPAVTNDLWVAIRLKDRQRSEIVTARAALLGATLPMAEK